MLDPWLTISPPDKSVWLKIIFLIYQPKHMLWVLKRTVSVRRFFWAPKTYILQKVKKIITIIR